MCRLSWYSSQGRRVFRLALQWFLTPKKQPIICSIALHKVLTMCCFKKVCTWVKTVVTSVCYSGPSLNWKRKKHCDLKQLFIRVCTSNRVDVGKCGMNQFLQKYILFYLTVYFKHLHIFVLFYNSNFAEDCYNKRHIFVYIVLKCIDLLWQPWVWFPNVDTGGEKSHLISSSGTEKYTLDGSSEWSCTPTQTLACMD